MSLKWFAIGLGIGAGVTILTTPKTGSETRDALKDMAEKALERVKGKVEEERFTISDVIDEINEAKKIATDKAKDIVREAS
jgi:gas vesicle protein